MKILLATTNPHKLEEIKAVIDTAYIEWVLLSDIGRAIPEPVEDQDTFEGNAMLKAAYYAKETGMVTVADDSGLEVDKLRGEPGVRSARYSGMEGERDIVDPANNLLLLKKLSLFPSDADRAGRFVCTMAMCAPDKLAPIAIVRGTVEGRILREDEADDPSAPEKGRGPNGFGYDPLFVLTDTDHIDKTTAEITPAQKNALSHRGKAARLLWAKIQDLGLIEK